MHSTKIPLTWTETQHVIIYFTLNSKDEKLGDNFSPFFLAPDSTVLWPEFWATLSWSLQGIQQASVFLSSFDPTSFCNENITTNKILDQHVECKVTSHAKVHSHLWMPCTSWTVRKWTCRSSVSEQADHMFTRIRKTGKLIEKAPRFKDCSKTRISGDILAVGCCPRYKEAGKDSRYLWFHTSLIDGLKKDHPWKTPV